MYLRNPSQKGRSLPATGGLTLAMVFLLLGLAASVGLAVTNLSASAASAAELHVCPAGCAYDSVQAAVDAASDGDIVKVAAGIYVGVQSRPAPPGYLSGPAMIEQAVYLDKNVNIEGGYTPSNWITPDPEANVTMLDAQGQGRVLFVAGDISPMIAGLHLTGGDANGLGGHPWGGGSNTGGAVHVLTATANIRNCWVYENTADFGGGIYLDRSDSTIQDTAVTTNTAYWGGGLSLRISSAQIIDNVIAGNHASGSQSVPSRGGGIDMPERNTTGLAVIRGNTLLDNHTDASGGGLSLSFGAEATVSDNLISANTAITGGGVYLRENYVELASNTISHNTASNGGGVAIEEGAALLDQNAIENNTATGDGGGVYVQYEHYEGTGPSLTGNTIQNNSAKDGGGLATRNADVTITDNTFTDNQASGSGGGLDLFGSSETLVSNNTVSSNSANTGGGIFVGMFDGTLEGNRILANTASGGGGVAVFGGGTWTNNVIADNQAIGPGSGLLMIQGELELRHTTIARNSGDGGALFLTAAAPIPGPSEATLVNTILADSIVGIQASDGNTATVDSILWHNIPIKVQADSGASVSVQNEYTGNPAFDADGYHLTANSAALDQGIDAGVRVDIDGEPRPMLQGYDLGADELTGAHLSVILAASPEFPHPGEQVVYTAVITSDGAEDATGVELTLVLDGNQRPVDVDALQSDCSITDAGWGGSAVCTPGTLSLGTTVMMTVTAEVAANVTVRQEMVSTLTARANEMTGSAQVSVVAQDCHVRLNDGATEYTTVQAAVDAAAPGDRVKVAGTCLGAYERDGLRQQVHLDQDLTLQGGYTTTNWTTPDSEANPTTLDAFGQGRVIYVSPGISATIAGLHIANGDAAGQGGGQQGDDAGGGVYATAATLSMQHNHLSGNSAVRGGGVYLWDCDATLVGNTVVSNTASDYAGGLMLRDSYVTLNGNTVTANTGPGLCLLVSEGTLDGNVFTANAGVYGGGLALISTQATLTNNVVADNYAERGPGGIGMGSGSFRLAHTTIARNRGGDGSGILVYENRYGDPTTAVLTNTVLVSHSVGLKVTGMSTVTVVGVLWHNTSTTLDAEPSSTVSVQNEHTGDPAFDADGYHLTAWSAAIDRGVDAGVDVDIDGEPRPRGATYDLGADEIEPVADLSLTKRGDPDPVIVNQSLTYTLILVNKGPAQATGVVLTDTLPYNALYVSASPDCNHAAGTVTCNLGTMAPTSVTTRTVTVKSPSAGQLINLAEASAGELDPNATNNEEVAYTTVVPEPPPDPTVTGVTPHSGLNTKVTPITIEGDYFQDGATAWLGKMRLPSVTYVSEQRLLAVVPDGLAPGTCDLTVTNADGRSGTLARAFTVLTPDPPTVASLSPAQGPNDIPVTLDIRGSNFSPDIKATLRLNGDGVPLVDLVFMDSTHLLATVPVSTAAGLYDLEVVNPDHAAGLLASAYQVLEPAANNDLYAAKTDLWLDPPGIHQGQAVTVGLTLRRQGGQANLYNVDVRFYLAGGTPAFDTTVAVLPPRSAVTVTADWTPPPDQGDYTLYAQIDPADEIPENDEGNNLVSRMVTVLPPLPDTTPPTVDSFAINGRSVLYTYEQGVRLDTIASDNPGGSGVAYLLFVEYVYVPSRDDWHAVQQTGWIPYDEASPYYAWRLAWYQGAHYLQVWAADGAGNISVTPGSQMINFRTAYHTWIYRGSVRLYRQPMETGQSLRLWIGLGSYGGWVRFSVWAPDGSFVTSGMLYASYDSEVRWVHNTEEGVYQIEVQGVAARSEYHLTIVPCEGPVVQMEDAFGAADQGDDQPIVPPTSVPSRHFGLPSAPLPKKHVFLPVVLRSDTP